MLQNIGVLFNNVLRVLEKMILSAGAILDAANSQGWTALTLAARYGHLEIVQVMSSYLSTLQAPY